MGNKWCEIKTLLEKFNKFYWNSDIVNNISLIDELRLSTNIHETAHSRILYKFLCAHNQGSRQFLKLFLESVELSNILDINKVEIKVEYQHIDVLISDGEKCIIIENKVNHACDRYKQLAHYIDLLDKDKNKNNIYVLYLVRYDNDKDPSENSLSTERREELVKIGNYKKISYQTHILKWLRKCEKETNDENVFLKSALVQYRNYIENLFKEMEQMSENDIKEFEKDVLNISVSKDPIVDPVPLVESTDKVKQKMKTFNEVIVSYENDLCKRYLEHFKEKTNIKNSLLNSSNQIVFNIKISETNVQFTYDFLKRNQYVWFGTKYPLKGRNECNQDEGDKLKKIIENNLLDGYKLDNYDNYKDCADKDFMHFYSDAYWFCKYCKDNETAIKEIAKYKDKIEALVCK